MSMYMYMYNVRIYKSTCTCTCSRTSGTRTCTVYCTCKQAYMLIRLYQIVSRIQQVGLALCHKIVTATWYMYIYTLWNVKNGFSLVDWVLWWSTPSSCQWGNIRGRITTLLPLTTLYNAVHLFSFFFSCHQGHIPVCRETTNQVGMAIRTYEVTQCTGPVSTNARSTCTCMCTLLYHRIIGFTPWTSYMYDAHTCIYKVTCSCTVHVYMLTREASQMNVDTHSHAIQFCQLPSHKHVHVLYM